MEKILVFDNYDSFTYNLVHYIEKLTNVPVEVHRNDCIALEEIDKFSRIVLSPGPGIPSESGILLDVIKAYAGKKPIFGVCLGHQAIAEAFGGKLINLNQVYHGVASPVNVLAKDDPLYKDIPATFNAGRYHSWLVSSENLPDVFEVTCMDDQQYIMGISHKQFNLKGVQFHPESILTEFGEKMIHNWLNS